MTAVSLLFLHRAEFAEQNAPTRAALDGLGIGLGFTLALTLAGVLRELLGSGSVFGVQAIRADIPFIGILAQPPGAFLTLALLVVLMRGGEFGARPDKWTYPKEEADET